MARLESRNRKQGFPPALQRAACATITVKMGKLLSFHADKITPETRKDNIFIICEIPSKGEKCCRSEVAPGQARITERAFNLQLYYCGRETDGQTCQNYFTSLLILLTETVLIKM